MRARCVGLALLLVALSPAAARAQGGTVRVYEATFNELASRIQPLTMTGQYRLRVTVATPFGPASWTVCDSAWTATVSQLSFRITPATATLNGRVDATWCGVAFNSTLATSADVRYDPLQKVVNVSTSPTSIQPRFNVLGFNISLPFFIDVAPSLTLPSIPLVTGLVYFETSRGIVDLRVSPQNVTVNKRNGYVEIQGDVSVW